MKKKEILFLLIGITAIVLIMIGGGILFGNFVSNNLSEEYIKCEQKLINDGYVATTFTATIMNENSLTEIPSRGINSAYTIEIDGDYNRKLFALGVNYEKKFKIGDKITLKGWAKGKDIILKIEIPII